MRGGVSLKAVACLLSSAGVAVVFLGSPVAGSATFSSSLGPWSDPAEILPSNVFDIDAWDTTLYVPGLEGMTMSPDNGISWQTPLPFDGSIAVEDFILYRVCMADPYGTDIFFTKSTDNGSTWSPWVQVMTLDIGNDGCYRIFKFGGTLIIYSYDGVGGSSGHIEMSRSVDGGVTWSPSNLIDPSVHMNDYVPRDMVLFNGRLYLPYHYDSDFPDYRVDVVISSSDDMGASWTERNVVTTGCLSSLEVDGGTMYLSYMGSVGSVEGICISKTADGIDWSTPQLVGPMKDFTDPTSVFSVAADGGHLFVGYLLYTDNGPSNRTYFLHINFSADDGITWDDLGDVTGGNGDEMIPSLLIHMGRLHFTWVDMEGVISWHGHTFYRYLEIVEEPIPEFGSTVIPIMGTILFASACVILRRRNK